MPREPPRLPPKKPRLVRLSERERLTERERPVSDLITLGQRLRENQEYYKSLLNRKPEIIGYGYDSPEVVNWAEELNHFLSTCSPIFLKRKAEELVGAVRYILTYLQKDTRLNDSLWIHLDELQKYTKKR